MTLVQTNEKTAGTSGHSSMTRIGRKKAIEKGPRALLPVSRKGVGSRFEPENRVNIDSENDSRFHSRPLFSSDTFSLPARANCRESVEVLSA
jgi:hypothetical protein